MDGTGHQILELEYLLAVALIAKQRGRRGSCCRRPTQFLLKRPPAVDFPHNSLPDYLLRPTTSHTSFAGMDPFSKHGLRDMLRKLLEAFFCRLITDKPMRRKFNLHTGRTPIPIPEFFFLLMDIKKKNEIVDQNSKIS